MKPISHLINQDIRHKNVIINLWSDSNRELDIIGGSDNCIHLLNKGKSNCNRCGAFMGILGKERDPLLYYKHLDLLSQSFTNSDNVFILTSRPFPEDYILPVFGMAKHNYKDFKYRKVYTLYNKVNPSIHSPVKTKVSYVIHYTNEESYLWKNKFVHRAKDDILSFLINSDTLMVNPSKENLRYYHREFTFFIPNSGIMVLLEDRFLNKVQLYKSVIS